MMIYRVFKFLWVESSGTAASCINDVFVGDDEEEAFGPGGVGSHDGVVYVIDVGANTVLHVGFALSCNFAASFEGFGIVDARVSEFPSVFWMGLTNVDDEKVHTVVICCIKIAEADRLTNKGRSCEAAENERDGFFFGK
jgi:hypothetical protein